MTAKEMYALAKSQSTASSELRAALTNAAEQLGLRKVRIKWRASEIPSVYLTMARDIEMILLEIYGSVSDANSAYRRIEYWGLRPLDYEEPS